MNNARVRRVIDPQGAVRRLEASVLLSPTIKTTPHIWGAQITKITNQNSHSLACNPRLAPAAMLFSLLLWHSSSDASQLAVGLQPHGVWLSKSTSHRLGVLGRIQACFRIVLASFLPLRVLVTG